MEIREILTSGPQVIERSTGLRRSCRKARHSAAKEDHVNNVSPNHQNLGEVPALATGDLSALSASTAEELNPLRRGPCHTKGREAAWPSCVSKQGTRGVPVGATK